MVVQRTENYDDRAITQIHLALVYLSINALDQVSPIVNTYAKALSQHSNRAIKAGSSLSIPSSIFLLTVLGIFLVEGLWFQAQNRFAEAR